jgi:murein DD-endopeptidase MepM/ murein hydrolase activator NlpD
LAIEPSEYSQDTLADNIKSVIIEIKTSSKEYEDTEIQINNINNKIDKNYGKLAIIRSRQVELKNDLKDLTKEKNIIQNEVLKLTSKKYYLSMAIQHTNKKSTKSILDKEVYTVVFNSIKNELISLDIRAKKIDDLISENQGELKGINSYITKQQSIVEKKEELSLIQKSNINKLRKQHRQYVKYLQGLSIDNTFQVGKKTISPLGSFVIVKRFGNYFDKSKNTTVHNNGITLKPKGENAGVQAMYNGTVVFVRNNSADFDNTIILQHAGNLYTIYSNLDLISPRVKIGKKVSRGYTLGKVNNKLILKVTKNEKYLDPEKLFGD